MKNQPLLVSIVIGIIVIFVIVGASLVAKLSNVSKLYKSESLKTMQLEELSENLKSQIATLNEENNKLKDDKKILETTVSSLKEQIDSLTLEVEKLERIKEVFEEKLKEELMKEEELKTQKEKPGP